MMYIKLFQINSDRDPKRVIYEPFNRIEKLQGSPEVDPGIYDKVFEALLPGCDDLEDVFKVFNLAPPKGFYGRSMSVSDVVGVKNMKNGEWIYYFCDSIGFIEIRFNREG